MLVQRSETMANSEDMQSLAFDMEEFVDPDVNDAAA